MQIIIENCSSAGAHFSDKTNNVLLKIHKWITENNEPSLRFIEFRGHLKNDMGINDNNARNIYPLLKNCGFAEYAPGDVLDTSKFFTPKGTAYIMSLEALQLIEKEEYTQEQKRVVSLELKSILYELVYEGVAKLVHNDELNYSESMKWFIMFLLEYGKINKNEFAYMVYQMSNDDEDWKFKTKSVIEGYRNKEITIDVKVRVRNDQDIKKKTGETTRLEEISYFTAYSYYAALFVQAGLIHKGENYYYYLKPDERIKMEKLLEV